METKARECDICGACITNAYKVMDGGHFEGKSDYYARVTISVSMQQDVKGTSWNDADSERETGSACKVDMCRACVLELLGVQLSEYAKSWKVQENVTGKLRVTRELGVLNKKNQVVEAG